MDDIFSIPILSLKKLFMDKRCEEGKDKRHSVNRGPIQHDSLWNVSLKIFLIYSAYKIS